MGRIADSTIKGFMYQFNLSLNEILKSSDEVIRMEGIIEDIDKVSSSVVTAIQCKYHEMSEALKLRDRYTFQEIANLTGINKRTLLRASKEMQI